MCRVGSFMEDSIEKVNQFYAILIRLGLIWRNKLALTTLGSFSHSMGQRHAWTLTQLALGFFLENLLGLFFKLLINYPSLRETRNTTANDDGHPDLLMLANMINYWFSNKES